MHCRKQEGHWSTEFEMSKGWLNFAKIGDSFEHLRGEMEFVMYTLPFLPLLFFYFFAWCLVYIMRTDACHSLRGVHLEDPAGNSSLSSLLSFQCKFREQKAVFHFWPHAPCSEQKLWQRQTRPMWKLCVSKCSYMNGITKPVLSRKDKTLGIKAYKYLLEYTIQHN